MAAVRFALYLNINNDSHIEPLQREDYKEWLIEVSSCKVREKQITV